MRHIYVGGVESVRQRSHETVPKGTSNKGRKKKIDTLA